MKTLYLNAVRLLTAATSLAAFETACAMMALAVVWRQAVDEEQASWESLFGERTGALPAGFPPGGATLTTADDLVGALRAMDAGDDRTALIDIRAVAERRPVGAHDAYATYATRKPLLAAAWRFLGGDGARDPRRVAVGRAALVIYLIDLDRSGQCTRTAEEKRLFGEAFGLDLQAARDAVRAYALVREAAVLESLEVGEAAAVAAAS